MNTATGPLGFTVGDVETAAGQSDGEREFEQHDAGAEREHRVRGQRGEPDGDGDAGGQPDGDGDDHGDGERRAVERERHVFVLTVNAVNTPPTISDIAASDDQRRHGDGADWLHGGGCGDGGGESDGEREFERITTLVPNGEHRVWGQRGEPDGDGDAGGQPERDGDDHGDGERRAVEHERRVFVLTVNAVNDAPTITNIADQTTTVGTATGPIGFTVGDVETAAGSLTVSGSSIEHDAGAEWEHRVWRQRGQPDGDGDAGGQSDGDGDDHGDGERRAVTAQRQVLPDGQCDAERSGGRLWLQ